ncbi:NAD(P)/FAD-dependent oxidoreductase [Flavobacterium sp.]
MENQSDIVIIGAGLAGLMAAIHLSKDGFTVTIIEKNDFPKHKVCGEYISNEVLPYVDYLQLDFKDLDINPITQLEFSLGNGTSFNAELPLGGFGVSRYALDFYLYQKAKALGCIFLEDEVKEVTFSEDIFSTLTAKDRLITSKVVLGAFGKRSNLDISMQREFIQKKSHWLAVKAHYSGEFPNDLVGLHNFEGGYCGISKVENNIINICYLAQYNSFKKYKNIDAFQEEVLMKNPKLKTILGQTTMVFEKPITISQISFETKAAVENHILMIGDAAGLIHPLCGNGMAMAMHSAKLASNLSIDFLQNKMDRNDFEKQYTTAWNANFSTRIQFGKLISKMLLHPKFSEIILKILLIFPFSLSLIIKKTHGKPF